VSRSPSHVVIVGGGISGLSTAFFVMEEAEKHEVPIHCTVIERDARWGGKILTNHLPNLLIEGGPDSFLTSKPWAMELCKTLGLGDQLIPTNAENNRTFSLCRGALRELPQGLLAFRPQRVETLVSGGLLSWRGLLRMGAERFWPKSSSGLSEETVGSFFRRRFGVEAFDYLIEPLVAGIYAGDADELSLEATFPRFKELEQQYGSVIKGMREAQAKTKKGMPRKSPGASSSLFMTLRNGLGELIETLTQRLIDRGVQLMTGSGCREIQASPQNRGSFLVTLDNDAILTADAVVLATPAFQTAPMIRQLEPEVANLLEQIPYTSTATISLAYPTEAVEGHIQGFGFVVPRKEQRPLLAGTWTSLKWPYRSQKGETLIRGYVGGRGREHILENDDTKLVESVCQELQTIVGITASPNYTEVHRWDRGMPQYTVGHQARVAKIQELLRPRPTLQISGAGLSGIGIPDCIREGNRVAGNLVKSLLSASNPITS
jgi:oxygen-dependent protoporphyrinogen oxidase